jgi:YegS/Rv2252/BmrU family lipid kinase
VKTTILLNRSGGSAADRERVERALKDAGLDNEIRWLEGHEIAGAAASAVEKGATRLVAGGGDGTVGAVAGVVAGTGVELGILPLGTLNHFARELAIPEDIAQAARTIAQGETRTADVAEVNGRVFVNNSAIGIYPLMVVNRDLQRQRLGRGKALAMLVAAVRVLARFKHHHLEIRVGDGEASVDTPLLFVGNNEYRMRIDGGASRESLSDGELFVLVMKSRTRLGFLAAIARALAGRARKDDMVRLTGVIWLQVSSPRTHMLVSLDGEVARMEPPIDYRIRPRALKVIVPASSD